MCPSLQLRDVFPGNCSFVSGVQKRLSFSSGDRAKVPLHWAAADKGMEVGLLRANPVGADEQYCSKLKLLFPLLLASVLCGLV